MKLFVLKMAIVLLLGPGAGFFGLSVPFMIPVVILYPALAARLFNLCRVQAAMATSGYLCMWFVAIDVCDHGWGWSHNPYLGVGDWSTGIMIVIGIGYLSGSAVKYLVGTAPTSDGHSDGHR